MNDSRPITFAVHATHVTTIILFVGQTYSNVVLINHNYKTPTRIVKSHKLQPVLFVARTRTHYYRLFSVSTLINRPVHSIFSSRLSVLHWFRFLLNSIVEKWISRCEGQKRCENFRFRSLWKWDTLREK